MSTPYHHHLQKRRLLASVLLGSQAGFQPFPEQSGQLFVPTYSTATRAWTSGNDQTWTRSRVLLVKLSCRCKWRWRYSYSILYWSPLECRPQGVEAGIPKGRVVKRVQKLVTFLYKWTWFHTCPPYAPLDFFLLKSMPSVGHISRPPTPSSSQAVLEQQQQRAASPEHFSLSPRTRSGWWMRNQARKVPKRALRWLGMDSQRWSMK